VKILLLSYFYAPEASPGAYRWSPVAERWAEQGHEVEVVCAWKPGLLRHETIDGVRVRRVGGGLVESARKLLRGGAAAGSRTDAPAVNSATRSTASLLKRLHDLTWKKMYWPDFACPWFFPALGEARRLLSQNGHDAMLSTSFPFTTHLVGFAAKRRHPDVSWTVDMGDPFSFVEGTPNNNHSLYSELNHRAEAKVFDSADAVAVTPQAARKYAEVFPKSATKMSAVPLPLTPIEGAVHGPRVFPSDGKTRFVFVGRLYRRVRPPDFLLRLFAMLLRERPDAELHFFGDLEECRENFRPYESLIGESVFLHGPVVRERVLRAVGDASVVVNIANDTRYQMPSKVVEYVAAGKPVLNLTKIEDDSSARFLEGYPAVLNLMDPGGAPTRAQLDELVQFTANAPETLHEQDLKDWLAPLRPEAVAASYERLLREGMNEGIAGRDRRGRADLPA
jgi:glycosyltransferase involved in cell wall biosynthesis